MAEIFQGTQVPAWLQEIAKPVDAKETGEIFGSLIASVATSGQRAKEKNKTLPADQQTNWLGQIGPGFRDNLNRLKDPLWDYHVQQSQLGLAQSKIQMDADQLKLQTQKKNVADLDHDQQVWHKWLTDYPSVQSRENAPPPELFSKQYQDWYDTIKLRDSQGSVQKSMQATQTQFNKDLANLDPTERATVMQMPKNPDGSPSKQQLEYIRLSQQLKTQREHDAAAKARREGKGSPHIKIVQGPKGQTITYDWPSTAGEEGVVMIGGVAYIRGPKGGLTPLKERLTAAQVEEGIYKYTNLAGNQNTDPKVAAFAEKQVAALQDYLAKQFPNLPGAQTNAPAAIDPNDPAGLYAPKNLPAGQ